MNKKLFVTIVIVLCLLLIAAGVTFWSKEKNVNNSLDLAKTETCNPYLNIDEIARTGDDRSCSCLVDTVKRGLCQSYISDASYYSKAVDQTNISLCDSISLENMKKACVGVVQEKIDYIQGIKNQNLTATSIKQK